MKNSLFPVWIKTGNCYIWLWLSTSTSEVFWHNGIT